jgi:hypothetical protein
MSGPKPDIYNRSWVPPQPELWTWVPQRTIADPDAGEVSVGGYWKPNTGDPELNSGLMEDAFAQARLEAASEPPGGNV